MVKLILIVALLSVSGIIGGFCWPYSLNAWLEFFGKDPSVVYWQGFVLGYVPGLGQMSIPVAVITWIMMLFLWQ